MALMYHSGDHPVMPLSPEVRARKICKCKKIR
jgi:hypothetical protein